MQILMYSIIAMIAIYLGKIEKKLNVATLCIPLAIPLGIFTAIGATIALYALIKMALFIILLIVLLLMKLKVIIGYKLVAALGAAAGILLGIITGPIGWVMSAILTIILIFGIVESIKEAFVNLYTFCFSKFALLLMGTRNICDKLRNLLPFFLKFIVLTIEVPIVCGLSINSLWGLMNWLDGDIIITPEIATYRSIAILPFVVILYRSYIKDTTPPENGKDGIDIPMPIDLGSSITTTISH